MLSRIGLPLLLGVLWGSCVFAQSRDSVPERGVEIGINITYVLTNVLGNVSPNAAADPYQISVRIGGPRRRFRTGLAVLFNHVTVTQSSNPFEERRNRENRLQGRLGYEWVYPVHRLGGFYWGVDVVGDWSTTINESTLFTGPNRLEARLEGYQVGVGGGPVLGLLFKPHPRLALTTEAALYPIFRSGQQDISAPPDVRRTSTRALRVLPTLPTALFLNLLF